MKIDVAVDIGNTRMKWGRCDGGAVAATVSLPANDPAAWQRQRDQWQLRHGATWAVAGVHPERCSTFLHWLQESGGTVVLLDSHRLLPLTVALPQPAGVGMDRLLNAVAANGVRPPAAPALIIDAGSAVTVDFVDAAGVFRGGAIFPGFRLMSLALHDHTALLPLVQVESLPPITGTNTIEAIQAGIFWSILGGTAALVRQHRKAAGDDLAIFLTGGDASLLADQLQREGIAARLWPEMTLEGVRLAAEAPK